MCYIGFIWRCQQIIFSWQGEEMCTSVALLQIWGLRKSYALPEWSRSLSESVLPFFGGISNQNFGGRLIQEFRALLGFLGAKMSLKLFCYIQKKTESVSLEKNVKDNLVNCTFETLLPLLRSYLFPSQPKVMKQRYKHSNGFLAKCQVAAPPGKWIFIAANSPFKTLV